jgi:choline dehydrogenase-like flavoprotein
MVTDYIIVGGGAAGCVIAARLSEDRDVSVLLLEQGPRDSNPYIHLPVTYYKTAKGALLSRYEVEMTTPGRNAPFPEMVQGRVLGGGSSVNGMNYMRGNPADYDGWVADGATGWSWADVLPYFRKSETNESLGGPAHGSDGPLHVSDQRQTSPLTKAWLRACQDHGIPFNPDFNAGHQPGCGLYQVMMRNGRRSSSATAYLGPARGRANLDVRTGVTVRRILVEKGRAVGVEAAGRGGVEVLRADREVIVCGGGVGSPHLLLRSGIGPADHLREVGVPVLHDLPGVGRNFQDHIDVMLVYDLNGPHSYDRYKRWYRQIGAGLQYLLFRNGPVTSNIAEGGLCWYGADPGPGLAEVQFHFLAGAGVEEGTDTAPSGNGCTINVGVMRPRSRGQLTLRSADPVAPPRIDARYLTDPYDAECMAEGVRLMQEIMEEPAIARFVAAPYKPTSRLGTREERLAFVRNTMQGALHPCGGCAMGGGPLAVLDPAFRVRGLEGLRVADSSAMPRIVSGNLNGPTVMMAERAADFLRGVPAAPDASDGKAARKG